MSGDRFEALLGEVLADVGEAAPREGMAGRVMARVGVAERGRSWSTRLLWSCAGVFGVAVLTLAGGWPGVARPARETGTASSEVHPRVTDRKTVEVTLVERQKEGDSKVRRSSLRGARQENDRGGMSRLRVEPLHVDALQIAALKTSQEEDREAKGYAAD